MQPYQEASEEIKRQGLAPLKALKTGASLAATTAGGGALFNKVMPFLSQYIPQELAIKGLSKINPGFGKFINNTLNAGHDFEEIKDFIKEKAEESQAQQTPKQQNIIQQYDDKLNAFIDSEIQKGRTPLEAGALARVSGKFDKAIKQMEKDHKANFSDIIEATYGSPQQANPAQSQPQQQAQTSQGGIDPKLLQIMQSIRSGIQTLRGA